MAKDENGLHIQTPDELEAQLRHLLTEGDRRGDPDNAETAEKPDWMNN